MENRPSLAKYYENFKNIHVYCFDLAQYDPFIDTLDFTVWANYGSETYFRNEITVSVRDFCSWHKNKWILIQGEDIIKISGLQGILNDLADNGKLYCE